MSKYVSRPFLSAGAFFALLLSLAVPAPVAAGGARDSSTEPVPRDTVVLASTSWLGAMAAAAGAENVRVLAPLDLRHPPEYELKPSDLAAAGQADLIIYAGWEQFAEQLADTAGSAGVRTLRVQTSNDPEEFKAEAAKIAQALGTEEKLEAWWGAFLPFAEDLREKVLAA
jgi:ABC-type Zn uptake system ZnuABC Zn-binding protein ZnuA